MKRSQTLSMGEQMLTASVEFKSAVATIRARLTVRVDQFKTDRSILAD